jgi:hypothetical protein
MGLIGMNAAQARHLLENQRHYIRVRLINTYANQAA